MRGSRRGGSARRRRWIACERLLACRSPAVAVPLLAVALLTAGCSGDPVQRTTGAREETALVARHYEVRLSTGTRWAPCPEPAMDRLAPLHCGETPADLGSSASAETPTAGLSAADPAAPVAPTRGDGASPLQLGHSGRLSLVVGGAAHLNDAVRYLRAAASRAPDDSAAMNDLAAAYYVRAQETGAATDLVHALGAVERGAALAPNDPVVAFNRALVLDRLQVLDAARDAWEHFLRLDPASEWGREAERRRAALPAPGERPPAENVRPEDDPQTAREYLLDDLLARWAELADEQGSESPAAVALLADAAQRAARLAEVTGDDLLLRIVHHVEQARQSAAAPRLARAHRLYAEASRLQAARKFTESRPVAEQATRDLTRLGSPLAGWARHLLLRCDYHDHLYADLERTATRIVASLAPQTPSALRGRTLTTLGSARFADGRLEAAGAAFRGALADFERLGEERTQAGVLARLAPWMEWIGRVDEGWRLRWESLARQRTWGADAERRTTLMDGALFALDLGEPEAALALIDEVVGLAERSGVPAGLHSAYLKRAEVRRSAGRGGGLDDLDRAEAAVERMDPGEQPLQRALVAVERARWLMETSPWRARRLLEASVAEVGRAELLLPGARIALARAQRLTGDAAAAGEQLAEALSELDRQRRTVSGDFERIALAENADAARRELATLFLEEGDGDGALAVLESGRARRLRERLGEEPGRGEGEGAAGLAALDATAATSAARRHLARLSRELPADLGVVTWALLDDRLAVWAWTSDGAWFASEPVGRGRLTELVNETRQEIFSGEADTPREGAPETAGELPLHRRLAALYDHLLAPVAERLEGRSSLLLVPEGPLFEVPFAALVTPSGRYLVEDFALSLAPGLLAVRFTDAPAPPPRSLLVVADPAFDREAHPELSRLAGAAREGRRIAEVYAEAGAEVELLEGEAATAERFLSALGRYDVVHVAAHGVGNAKAPFLSYLLMAPETCKSGGNCPDSDDSGSQASGVAEATGADGDGLVTGLEVLAASAEEAHGQPRLVVLATCDSAGRQVTASEGPLGLAWPFLARGTDAVVATLWSLDDAASERLFVQFHDEMRTSQDPAQALRRAQLEAVHLRRPAASWASSETFVRRLGVEN